MQISAVAVGGVCTDFLVNLEEFPQMHKRNKVLATSWQFGGKVASGIAALGRQGVPCGIVTNVGGDPDGKAQIKDFNFNGVDTSHVVVDPAYETGLTIAISEVTTNTRTFLGVPRNTRRMKIEDLNKEYIQSAKVLLISGGDEVSKTAAQWMHEAGGQVIIDADGYNELTDAITPMCDVFIPSEFYYKTLFGEDKDPLECCKLLAERGPHTVIITLGEKGCVGVYKGGTFSLPAFDITPRDTTGAGDVFHGAYIYGMLKGWDAPECARWASATSAIKCVGMGGRAALPTEEMVQKFIATGEIDWDTINARHDYYRKIPYVEY